MLFRNVSGMNVRFVAVYSLVGLLALLFICVYFNNTKLNQERDELSTSGEEERNNNQLRAYEENNESDKSNPALPRSKNCIKDLPNFLNLLQERQAELVDDWYKAHADETMRWVSLLYIYSRELVKSVTFYSYKSDKEDKYLLDFVDPSSSCNIWTLGVGMEYSGEKTLHGRYPHCKFTAVDPMSEVNKALVESVPGARFVQATIGSEDGNYTARLANVKYAYYTTTIQHTAITRLLQEHNGQQIIDMMSVDIEGAEFGVLAKLIENKEKLPAICQMNLELHWPPSLYGFTSKQVFQQLHQFFSDGTYTVMNAKIWGRFLKIFVVNTKSPECVQKFFC